MRAVRTHTVVATLLLLVGTAACQKASKDKPAAGSAQGSGQGSGSATVAATPATPTPATGSGSAAVAPVVVDPPKDIDSKDILARTETAPIVYVKHVLLGWKELPRPGQGDERAAKRSNAEAAALAKEIEGKLKASPDSIDALIKEHSEDPGSLTGEPYTVKADAPFVPEFKNLALRLKEKEVGIVKTNFGYHVIERIPPPPPDPLESNDILARNAGTDTVWIQHVLIGWKDTAAAKSGRGDPRGLARSKADADKLAKDVLGKVRAKADMAKLMKEFSEDPGSKDTARAYDVTPNAAMVEPFKNLALRLKLNEAGLIKSPYGWHVMKRVAPPPPDPLESVDILKREPVTAKAKVKHILLGWKDVNSSDPRAQKRDRKTLEEIVKSTLAGLKKGTAIETLMADLSEDPGSATSGEGYDVTPDAGFVPPFKALSLRLNVGEVGVVKTDFGMHIIKRIE
jgi:parvulin-like peptidyl-prolyl isomerase